MRVDEIESGDNVSGQYSLLEVMGDPGYEVFRARASDGSAVVLRYSRGRTPFETRAAIELCENAMRLRHPMLAAVYRCDQFDDGSVRVVSEYVAGRSLDAWLGDAGIPPLPISVDFVRRVAMILQHAHGQGVTHHALYPGNIVVLEPETRPHGRIAAKLLDLGVHRAMRGPTRFEAAHFMAPEALATELRAPEHALAIDVRMNVYSCGCLLHYLCTGQLPYQSDSLEGLTALHRAGRRRQLKLPEELAYVIGRALEIDPKQRTPGMAELARGLSYVESVWRSSGVRRRAAPPPLPARSRPSEAAPRLAPAIAAALSLRPVAVKTQSAGEPPPPMAANVPIGPAPSVFKRAASNAEPGVIQVEEHELFQELDEAADPASATHAAIVLPEAAPLPAAARAEVAGESGPQTAAEVARSAEAVEVAAAMSAVELESASAESVERAGATTNRPAELRTAAAVQAAKTETPDAVAVSSRSADVVDTTVAKVEAVATPSTQSSEVAAVAREEQVASPSAEPIEAAAVASVEAVATPSTRSSEVAAVAREEQVASPSAEVVHAAVASVEAAASPSSEAVEAAAAIASVEAAASPSSEVVEPAGVASVEAAAITSTDALEVAAVATVEQVAPTSTQSSEVAAVASVEKVASPSAEVIEVAAVARAEAAARPSAELSEVAGVVRADEAASPSAKLGEVAAVARVDAVASPSVHVASVASVEEVAHLAAAAVEVAADSNAGSVEVAAVVHVAEFVRPRARQVEVARVEGVARRSSEHAVDEVVSAAADVVTESASFEAVTRKMPAAPKRADHSKADAAEVQHTPATGTADFAPHEEDAASAFAAAVEAAAVASLDEAAASGAAAVVEAATVVLTDTPETSRARAPAVVAAPVVELTPASPPAAAAPRSSVGPRPRRDSGANSSVRNSLTPVEVAARRSNMPRGVVTDVVLPITIPKRTQHWRWVAAVLGVLSLYAAAVTLRSNSEPTRQTPAAASQVAAPPEPAPPVIVVPPDPAPAPPPTSIAAREAAPAAPELPRAEPVRESPRVARAERKAAAASRAGGAVPEAAAPIDPLDTLSVDLPPPPVVSDPIGPGIPRVVRLEPVWRTPNVVAFSESARPQPSAARSASRGGIRTGSVEVHGSLTKQQASYAIERIQPQLRQCYVDHGSAAPANVQIELIIDDVGRVRNLQVRGAVPALAECVVQVSRKLLSGLPYSGAAKIAWNVKFD